MKWLGFAVSLAALGASPALASCVNSLTGYTPPAADSVQVVGHGFPAAYSSAVDLAIGEWNASNCNESGGDFPYFQTASGAPTTIHAYWHGGINTQNPRTCGTFDLQTHQIDLYEQARDEAGILHSCGDLGAIADNLAHELGHYLGLADSDLGCQEDMIMARATYGANGAVIDTRNPIGWECETVDLRIETPYEQQQQQSGEDPWCNAYCWTTCIGSLCPSGNPWCPILIDLENDGIRLTGIEDPVLFDIDADGDLDLLSWTDRSEGMLALDRNGNDTIDDGGELFGNATRLADGARAPNGYVALAELDSFGTGGNQDGAITAADEAFNSLRMWTDLNHDGISQPEELLTLPEAGIVRMDLDYKSSHRTDPYGNEFRFLGRAWKENRRGVVHPVLTWDVFFVVAH